MPRSTPGLASAGESSAAGLDHFRGVGEEFGNVDAHDGGGNHAEIGERGVAAADAGDARKNFAKFVALGDFLHFRAGIGDGDEAIADFRVAHFFFYALEEILLVDVGLEGAAGFAGDDADGAGEIDFAFDGFDLRGIGGIEDVQLRVAVDFSKRHAQNFRTQAGAAHAEQQERA